MAKFSFDELATQYVHSLAETADKDLAIRKIAREINGLAYADTGKHLSVESKLQLVALFQKKLLDPDTRTDSQGRHWILKEADNKRYLELVGALKDLL